jgi:hypothetical protein
MREQMYGVSASFFDKVDNIESARQILRHLQANIINPQERKLIDQRLARLDGLEQLQRAAARYQRRFGHPPPTLDDLVGSKEIDQIPNDPLRMGYRLDESGTPRLVVKTPPKTR